MTSVDSTPTEAAVEYTEEQARHARQVFEAFDFEHPIFRDPITPPQPQIFGYWLRGYRTGLGRLMDVIEGRELEFGETMQGEAFDCLAQMYVARQLKRPFRPDATLKDIRDELAFADLEAWRRLQEEIGNTEYPEHFVAQLEPPREVPQVPTYEDCSIP